MNVKGTVLVDFIKTIRSDKRGVYDSYLTEDDRKIMEHRILPSAWYPYDTFKNCFRAVFEVLAKKDLDKVQEWGRLYGQEIMSGLYKGLLKEGDPMKYLKKYETYVRNFFDFGAIEVNEVSENAAELTIRGFDPSFAPIYYMMFGWLERTLELCGAEEIKSEILERSWEGGKTTRIRFSWICKIHRA